MIEDFLKKEISALKKKLIFVKNGAPSYERPKGINHLLLEENTNLQYINELSERTIDNNFKTINNLRKRNEECKLYNKACYKFYYKISKNKILCFLLKLFNIKFPYSFYIDQLIGEVKDDIQ